MGYFTETMNALLEFKGDAELAYANRREAETGTGRHSSSKRNPGGKDAYKKGSDYINSNNHLEMNKKDGYGNYSRTASHIASSTHEILDSIKKTLI